MDRTDSKSAYPTEDARYRLLIEAVTDYAIYMLDPDRHRDELEPRRAAFQGLYAPTKSSASISRGSTREEDQTAGLPARALETAAP